VVKKHVNACTRIACHLMPEEPIAFLSITPSKILIDLGGIEVKVGALDPRNVITRQRARPGIEQRQLVGSLRHQTKATGVVFTVGMLRENVGLPRLEALRFLVGLCNRWTAGIAHFRVRLVPVFVLLSAVPVCVEFIVFIMMRCARCTGTRHHQQVTWCPPTVVSVLCHQMMIDGSPNVSSRSYRRPKSKCLILKICFHTVQSTNCLLKSKYKLISYNYTGTQVPIDTLIRLKRVGAKLDCYL
jgi:hypothetical protein